MKYYSLLLCIALSCESNQNQDLEFNGKVFRQIDTMKFILSGQDSAYNHLVKTTDSIIRTRSKLPIIKQEDAFCASLINAGFCSKIRIFWPYASDLKLVDSTTGKYLRPYCLEINNPKVHPDDLTEACRNLAKIVNQDLVSKYANDWFDIICFSFLDEKTGEIKTFYHNRKNL